MKPLCLALSIEWDDCTVALAGADVDSLELSARALHAGQAAHAPAAGAQASRDVLMMVRKILSRAGKRVSDIERFYVNAGPGAFTSLRIAAGIVQGLALPRQRPVGTVGSLQALAASIPAWHGSDEGAHSGQGERQAADAWLLLTAIDARMNECYYGISLCRPGCWPETVLPPAVGPAEQARADFEAELARRGLSARDAVARGQLHLAGGAFSAFEPLADWARQQGEDPAVIAERRPGAARILALANAQGAPAPGAARDAVPLYVRDRVALDRDEQRRAAALREAARHARA